eukprot:1971227-Pyramimonas_sp.AAC.1
MEEEEAVGGGRAADALAPETSVSHVEYHVVVPPEQSALSEVQKRDANELIGDLKVLLGGRGSKEYGGFEFLFLLTNAADSVGVIVQCCSRLKDHEFTAEFTLCQCVLPDGIATWLDGVPDPPFTVQLRLVRADSDVPGSPIILQQYTEVQLAADVVQRGAGPWTFRRAQVDWESCSNFKELKIKAFDHPVDIAAEQQKQKERAAALRAVRLLKKAQNPSQEQRRKPKVTYRRRGGKPDLVAAALAAAPDPMGDAAGDKLLAEPPPA